MQITHFGGSNFVRDSIIVELTATTVASQFSRQLLRVGGEADPAEMPICGKFGMFPKTKSNACIFKSPKDSAIHLIPIINLFLKLYIVEWILKLTTATTTNNNKSTRNNQKKKKSKKHVLTILHGMEDTKHSLYIISYGDLILSPMIIWWTSMQQYFLSY